MTRGVEAGPPGPLTPRQAEVLAYLYETTRDTGIQPSFRELCEVFGWHSPHAVMCHLEPLARKGWVELPARRSRAVRLLRKPNGTKFSGFLDKEENMA